MSVRYVKGIKDADGEAFYLIYEHGSLDSPDLCLTQPEMDHLVAQYKDQKGELQK